jgi:alpha-beta hydrolase superfamily lysophospholipase
MMPNGLHFLGRPFFRRTGLALLIALVLWLVASWLCVYLLTRRAHPSFAEPAPKVGRGQLDPVRLQTADGQELGAWFVQGTMGAPCVLLLHGNGECRTAELPLGEFLAKEGCGILMLSLRAHGDSTGEVNDIGYSARHDVVAAVDYLERRCPGRPVLVRGKSLGAAAAIYAAKELGTRVRGYVLEAPYADLRTAVRHRLQNRLAFPIDRVAYAGLTLMGPLVLPEIDSMAPVRAISGIPASVPIILMAGSADLNARPDEELALYDRVRDHGRLIWFQEAGHVSYFGFDPARYREAVSNLLHATY